MNRIIGLMTLGILTMMVSALPAEEEPNAKEHYAATIMAVGGAAGGSTAPVDIWIDKFNTAEEAQELAASPWKSSMPAVLPYPTRESLPLHLQGCWGMAKTE